MRVLWLNHRDSRHPEAGGAEVRIREIGGRLVRKGCDVTLVSERWKGSEETGIIDGIEVLRMGGRYGVHLKAPSVLKKMEKEFDVVVDDAAHGVPWFSSLFTRKPVVVQVHHVHQKVAKIELPWYSAWFVALAERTIRYLYDAVVAISESTKQNLIEKLGVPSNKVKVILNGVDRGVYKPSKKSFDPLILWVGRIKRYKRVEHVILAFREVKKKMPDATLIIVGDGDYLRDVKRLATRVAVSDIHFLGRISEIEKVRLMGESWLMVGSSLVEGWGMSMMEAAACGTPSVAYDVPGLRDSVRTGETGILVEDGNVEALASGILKILENEDFREKLSKNALEYSMEFSWDTSAEQFLKILASVAGD